MTAATTGDRAVVTPDVAALLAAWGRRVDSVDRLESEVDDTFRLRSDDGDAILKIAPAGTARADLDFEHAVVAAALEVDPALPLARPIPTVDGESVVEVDGRWARLQPLLPGADAATARADAALVREIGGVSGALTAALAGFRHPLDRRDVVWDVRRLGDLGAQVPGVPDPAVRDLVDRAVDDLDRILPVLRALPAQVVHADLNGGNILVEKGRVTGIVDFGDALYAPRVCDVGIALCYTLGYAASAHAWTAPAAFLAGYGRRVPLTSEELRVLPTIARARAAQRILMSVRGYAAATADGLATPAPGRRDERRRILAASDQLRVLCEHDPASAPDAPDEWRRT